MIRIVTDTSADLPPAAAAGLSITLVPLSIRFGEEEFVDREDLTLEEFWSRLESAEELPQTAAPSPGRFEQAYRQLAAGGATGVVTLCISAKLSGTLQAAELAARSIAAELPVEVIDSRLVSGALGLAVMAAARSASSGASLAEVAAVAAAAADRSHVFGALDTLEYLRKGGRIGAAQAFFGGLLDVKPLITIDDGVVAPGGRVRTRRKARAAVLARAEQVADDAEEMMIIHSAASDVEEFRTALAGCFDAARTSVAPLGPVVGTHAGPGVLGVCYRLR